MKIIYALTDFCNGNCLHCYKRLNQSSLIARSIDRCKKDIEMLLDGGHHIILGGAENLTNMNYLEMYRLIGQRYILSNGILLSQDKGLCVDLTDAGIEEVHISWHIRLQDVINSVPEQIIKKAIDNIFKAGLAVKVLCVVGNLNHDLLLRIATEVKKAGVTSIKFFQLMPIHPRLRMYQMTAEQKEVALAQIKAIRSHYGEDLYVGVHGTFNAVALTEKRLVSSAQGNFCPAGRNLVTIDTDDKIYPCPFLVQSQFQIGIWENGQLRMKEGVPNDGKNCLAESQLIQQHGFVEGGSDDRR